MTGTNIYTKGDDDGTEMVGRSEQEEGVQSGRPERRELQSFDSNVHKSPRFQLQLVVQIYFMVRRSPGFLHYPLSLGLPILSMIPRSSALSLRAPVELTPFFLSPKSFKDTGSISWKTWDASLPTSLSRLLAPSSPPRLRILYRLIHRFADRRRFRRLARLGRRPRRFRKGRSVPPVVYGPPEASIRCSGLSLGGGSPSPAR